MIYVKEGAIVPDPKFTRLARVGEQVPKAGHHTEGRRLGTLALQLQTFAHKTKRWEAVRRP